MAEPQINRKAFVSHSHADKDKARELSRALGECSVEPWLDEWEIQPGDSLIQKIFAEGLRDCSVFLVLLSPVSIASRWVREELDVALVQRLEGKSRVIPILVESCEIPPALKPLRRLDMKTGVKAVAQDVADVVFNRRTVPPVAPPPSQLTFDVSGLTPLAARVAVHLFGPPEGPSEDQPQFHARHLAASLSLRPEDLDDAVNELEEDGVVKVIRPMGCAPFRFAIVMPTYRLALRLRGTPAIGYDPETDIRIVTNAIASQRSGGGVRLAALTELSPTRINAAVQYLDDRGLVKVYRAQGTRPFTFLQVNATSATRRFVAANA